MRKAQKKQTDELLELLGRIHKGIRQMIQAGQKTEAMDLLGQCQGAAIDLGETIEQTEGKGFVTVVYLEEYCESVYQIYEKLRQGQHVQSEKAYKHLKKALQKVKNSANNDIKVRTEAVFLPYKASMWDSLESVWKAADEDPDCDAYVIPIPYYDRNPDGSFREEHYEGDLYPEYVPVTSYQDYDFAEHCPDVVFIHNPYDECNYVTSVHPFFYSKNLKQYTEKLVYIPYFILGEIDPEDTNAVKGMEHFCTTPGVIYADQVIVQSEDMRKAYVNVMTEFAKKSGIEGMDRKYWEKKILGLGSPKVDKVLNTRKEDLTIPDEWLKIIEKPDGSWKKVIFYNTTVSALLQHGELYLEKMKDVFQVFYENREDVALLWRPHPLLEATIESMRPELAGEYGKVIELYKEGAWGIYDDTAELERAIEISDGYYGDYSSVVHLYKIIGKWAMILSPEKQTHLYFYDTVKVQNEIWFSAINTNGLYKINCETNLITFVCLFPNADLESTFLHSKVFYYKDKLIFIPFQAEYITVYDIKKEKTASIYVPECPNTPRYSFFNTAIQDEYFIYMIPCRYKKLIKFNVLNNHMELIDVIINDKEHKWKTEFPYTTKGACKVKNSLFLGCYSEDFVEKIDLQSGEISHYYISVSMCGISHLLYNKEAFWIIGNNGKLCKWDEIQGVQYSIDIELGNKNDPVFSDVVIDKDIIFMSGAVTPNIYIFNTNTNQKIVAAVGERNIKKRFKLFWGNYTSLYKSDHDSIMVMSALDGILYEVKSDGSVKSILDMSYDFGKGLVNYINVQKNKKQEENTVSLGKVVYKKLKTIDESD